MREGGRRGWKQTGGRREGRQTDRNNAFVASSSWDCSKCFTFQPWQKYSFKIHLNFSGKQLFWYQLLYRHMYIFMSRRSFCLKQFSQNIYTHVCEHSVFCSKCTCDFNVDRIGPLFTLIHTHTRTHEGFRRGWKQIGRWQADRQNPPQLSIPTPSRLLWEALSHAAITARRSFLHIFTAHIAKYSLIQMSELW